MSAVYFCTRSGREATLRGSERAWLAHLAGGIAEAAWDLDRYLLDGIDRGVELLSFAADSESGEPDAAWLHGYAREARTEKDRNTTIIAAGGHSSYVLQHRFIDALRTHLRVSDIELEIAGHRLHTSNIELNTALAAGSDPIRLAAKLHGWCEAFCWFAGPDRTWAADVIDQGLATGLYRRGIDRELDGQRRWASQGWEEVQALLRESDSEPVVCWFSGSEGFPDAFYSDWMPPWPDGVPKRWDALSPAQQAERTRAEETWEELSATEQWDRSFRWLNAHRPWAQITPGNLASDTFEAPVTIYDLFAPDRDDRIRAACQETQP